MSRYTLANLAKYHAEPFSFNRDISDLESEEEDESDGVISESDKTGITADHDSDLEDSSSDSDQLVLYYPLNPVVQELLLVQI